MSLSSSLVTLATTELATTEAAPRELPMPAWAFGAIALVCFVALLGLTWSFRNAGTKHGQQRDQSHAAAGSGHGSASPGGHH